MFELIRIYYISIKRSPLFDAKIFGKILAFIGFGYLFANLVFIGFFLDRIFEVIKPDNSPFDTFCRIFLFIWVIDIIVKFFFKSNKHIDIQSYLTLPIKLNNIFSLMFIKELLSKWNFIWVVILTPFFFKTFYLSNGLSSTFLLIEIVYFTSIITSFTLRFIDIIILHKSFLYYPLPLLFAICLGYLAFIITGASNLIIDISLLFSSYKIWIFIVMLLLFICLYVIFIKYSKYEIYSLLTGKNKTISSIEFNWFNQLGIEGEIIKLCFKEITRSQLKRNIFTSLLFLAYLLFFNNEAAFAGRLLLSLVPMLMIGSIFGEFTFIAESMLFDKLMTVPKDTPYLILKSKYLICLFIFAIFTIVSIVFTINKISILFWISIFFFGGGIMLFFIFQNAIYNKHRMDMLGSLRKLSNFNLHSFISMGCLILIIGIAFLMYLLTNESTTLYFMLILGVLFTFTSPFWLRNIYNRFLKRKYQNMNGFRNI
jgi:hypothetical protein